MASVQPSYFISDAGSLSWVHPSTGCCGSFGSDTGAAGQSLEQVKAIIADRLAHPRKLSPTAALFQGRLGFTAEDSQKWGIVEIPGIYRPWMRGSNPAGYFTQKILDAQKPTPAEKAAQHTAANEAAMPGVTAKLAATGKQTQPDSIFGNVKKLAAPAAVIGKAALSYAGSIPGIGTVVGAAGNALVAVAQGKSLADIASSAARGAIPGGPLVQAAVVAASNVAAAGIAGHNMAKAAGSEIVNAAVSMAPGPVQGMLKDTITAVASGKNVLHSVEASAVAAAINQIPPEARQVVKLAVQGVKDPASLLSAASGSLVGAAIAQSPAGPIASSIHSVAAQASSLANSAKSEILSAAVAAVPASAQNLVKQAIATGQAGRPLSSAQAVAAASALNASPPAVRAVVKAAIQGVTDPKALVAAAPPSLVDSARASNPAGAVAQSINPAAVPSWLLAPFVLQSTARNVQSLRPRFLNA